MDKSLELIKSFTCNPESRRMFRTLEWIAVLVGGSITFCAEAHIDHSSDENLEFTRICSKPSPLVDIRVRSCTISIYIALDSSLT